MVAVATYGPLAQRMFKLGQNFAKAVAEGKEEMDDAEWDLHVAEGDQDGEDFRNLVGR